MFLSRLGGEGRRGEGVCVWGERGVKTPLGGLFFLCVFLFVHCFSHVSLFVSLAFLFLFFRFFSKKKGSLHSGRSKVTRATVGRDTDRPTKVFNLKVAKKKFHVEFLENHI